MRRYSLLALLVVIVDRLTKMWAQQWLALQPGRSIALWPGVLHLTYAENTGMAFSLLSGRPWLLAALTGVVLAGLLVYLLWRPRASKPAQALLWLLFGGALGNLIDRVWYGYVVDFIEIRLFRFAIFNVADCFVTVCALTMIVLVLLGKETGHGAASR